ncbi:glycoside hydrolase family 16 protein [Curtobacterium sp. MCBD17_021]|uniref:glycoside hydrolase family 16 protein n=1 Tax=Curtobacterium sp. MCBD17_021 TaxID=2175665 RepID=UPI000DA7E855|nr:glycoside hydrolase family 16 protein [Curtobacterium sp. MCBD17_021]PZE64082.1 glycoside hydrolase family 16 protein [Curtobacterium sp. MCBD17_021]
MTNEDQSHQAGGAIDRRRLLTLGLGAAAAAGITGVAALRPETARAATTPALLAADEFDGPAGSAPNPGIWRYDLGGGGWGNGELEVYTDSRRNSALDGNGNLVITARREADGSYTSARLTSQGTYSVQYGRVEARIRIPRGQGIWPAFWMLGADLPQVGWPACGEIDVMENIGREPGTVHGTVHGPGYSGAEGIGGGATLPQGAFADDFHVYAVDWRPGSISWSVDGATYRTITPTDTNGDPWVFDKPFFVILNVAVGGGWPGSPDATTRFPQQMLVDWIRVWQNA